MHALRTFLLVTSLLTVHASGWSQAASSATSPLTQLAELTASDGGQSDALGLSVAMSATTIAAAESFGPAVYLFVKPAGGWSSATQTAKLTASDGTVFSTVAIRSDGGVVVAGAIRGSAVYIFVRPANGWANMTETAILSSSDQAQGLGISVAINGNTVVAGSQGSQNGSGPSTAYVFVAPPSGWENMTQTAELTPSDGGSPFYAVAISGNTVAVGAYQAVINSNQQQGAVYVFAKPPSGWTNMTQTAKLTASDGAANDLLGTSVAISGGTIVAGAPLCTIGSHYFQGAAYVFVKPSTGWISATQTAKLTDSDGKYETELGESVSVSGNTAVVGAPNQPLGRTLLQGAAYVFTKPATGWKDATQSVRLTAADGSGGLAASVAITGTTVAAGAPYVTVGSNKVQGAIYAFGTVQSKNAAAPRKRR